MKLSARLEALARHHSHSPSIWDIGCDHGKLGLSFLDHPLVREIHLVDPSDLVMKELKSSIDSHIPEGSFKIHLHHEKGQNVKLGRGPHTIFIAGMGGKEIQEILIHLKSPLLPEDTIVISPHRKILELRQYLSESYLCFSEELIQEDGQFYQILVLSTSRGEKVSLYGSDIWKGELGEAYRLHLIRAFEVHQDPLSMAFLAHLKGLASR